MATWTNATKSATTMTNEGFSNLTEWASSTILWADAGIGWANLKADVYSNQSKNATTFTNVTKN